jgi:hypothetical protein
MNRILFGFLFVIVFIQQLMAQDIKLGSSLKELTNSISNGTRIQKINLEFWVENEIFGYEISSNVLLLISRNYYPFGVSIKDDNPYYLIDFDGDSILDIQIEYLYVPHWVVSLNSREKNNSTNIENIFDMYYRAYQNNESVRNSELIFNGAKEIIQAGQNVSYQNRDILYIFFLYDYLYTIKEYELCIKYLELLDKTMISRFGGSTHTMILIYLVETLYRLGSYQKATEVNNLLMEWYPECIPGMVYQVLLEPDQNKKNNLMERILMNHSEHWLVKEKLL